MSIRNFIFANFLVFGLMCLRVQALNELPTEILQKEIFSWLAKSFSSRQKATWDEARKQLKKIGLVCKRFCLLTKDEREILGVLVPKAHYYAAIGDMDEIFACKFAYEALNCFDCFHMKPADYVTMYGHGNMQQLFEAVGYRARTTHATQPVTAEHFMAGINDNDATLIVLLALSSHEIIMAQPIKEACRQIFQKDALARSQAEKAALFVRQGILEMRLLRGETGVLEEMALCGANVNVQYEGWTPLMLAVSHGELMVCDRLLKHGVDISLESTDGATALIIAAKRKRASFLPKLILAGANVNEQNRFGVTPLMLATASWAEDCVQVLLQHGADVTLREKEYNLTALEWALLYGKLNCIPLLIEAGIKQLDLPQRFNKLMEDLRDSLQNSNCIIL